MSTLHRQQGATLIMALIMLVLLTLLALTSFNVGKSNLQVVSNMQQRDEAIAAARETIEETISTTRLFDSPAAVLNNPCNGVANTRCIDTNGDGVADITVALTPAPTCVMARPIPVTELDYDNKPDDRACGDGISADGGIEGAATGNSSCANTVWEVTAVATDAVTKARVSVTQGITVRINKDQTATNCE